MRRSLDREDIARRVCSAAQIYKKELLGKCFLYVFENQYIEVQFKKANFKHLTGLELNGRLRANQFFDLAASYRLQGYQFGFSNRHPYNLCARKIAHIHEIPLLINSECFILKDISTQHRQFRFGSTNLDFSICFGEDTSRFGTVLRDKFSAHSLRDGDCFSKSAKVFLVTHIFSKQYGEQKYTHLNYGDPSQIPIHINTMIDVDFTYPS